MDIFNFDKMCYKFKNPNKNPHLHGKGPCNSIYIFYILPIL